MIQSPPISAIKWHQQPTWQKYFAQLFAYYSRQWYAVVIGDQFPYAAVDSKNRRVFINPEQVEPEAGMIRFRPSSLGEFLAKMIQGLIAHEAGHVHFSAQKPSQTVLGQLWNALEDERMERLMAERFPELEEWFSFLGDTVLVQHMPTSKLLSGCLLHRWEHDRNDQKRFQPCPDQLGLWQQVKALVEVAWRAENSDQVTNLAREILALLGEAEDGAEKPELKGFDLLNEDFAGNGEQEPPPIARAADDETIETTGEASTEDQDPATELDESSNENAQNDKSNDQPEDEFLPTSTTNQGADSSQSSPNKHHPSSDDPTAPEETPGMPPVPSLDELNAEGVVERIEAFARELASLLKPFEPRKLATPSRNSGRLSPQRVMAQRDRVFERKVPPPKLETLFIDVLFDVSSSMGDQHKAGTKMFTALHSAMMVERACEIAGVKRRITAFDGGIHALTAADSDPSVTRGRIAGVHCGGSTLLSQALRHVIGQPTPAGAKRIVAVISDGDLDKGDKSSCLALVRRNPKLHFLPMLLGLELESLAAYESIFGHATPIERIELLPSVMRLLIARLR